MGAEALAGVILEEIEPLEDLAARLPEDFPFLAAERLGKEVDLALEKGVGTAEDAAPLRRGCRRPSSKCLGSRVDGGLGVGRAAAGEMTQHLARVGGVETGLVLFRRGRYPLAADEVLPALVASGNLQHGVET